MSSFNNALQGADMDCFQMTCWWTVTDRAARHYVDKSASAFLWIHEFHPSNQISCFERQKWQTKPQLKLPEGRWRLSQRESGQLEIFHAKHVSGSPKKRSKWFTGCSKHNFLFVAEAFLAHSILPETWQCFHSHSWDKFGLRQLKSSVCSSVSLDLYFDLLNFMV